MHAKILNPLWSAVVASVLSLVVTHAADWPQWRGQNRDGHADSERIISALPKDLKPVWKLPIGTGFSSPIVAGGSVFYADEQNKKETLHRIDAITAKQTWEATLVDAAGDEWGSGPRSTPFVDGDRVYYQTMNGEFRCFNSADGKVRWGFAFKDYGIQFLGGKAGEGTAARRGNNGSGVIDGDYVYIPVGAKGASIVCMDKLTGKEIWKALDDEAAYSSFVIATLAGTKQLVAFTADALVGMDLKNGKVLWRVPFRTGAKRHACTPVINGDTVTVNSQTIGLVCTAIGKQGEAFTATQLWADKLLKINLSTPVLVDGHFYNFGPLKGKDYVCVDARSGAVKWRQPGFGLGKDQDYAATIAVGKNLLVLTYDGQLFMVAADPAKYTELGRVQVCGKTWSHPALADGRLYVRDGRELQCFDLGAKQVTAAR
jgi:hypothetical protein